MLGLSNSRNLDMLKKKKNICAFFITVDVVILLSAEIKIKKNYLIKRSFGSISVLLKLNSIS